MKLVSVEIPTFKHVVRLACVTWLALLMSVNSWADDYRDGLTALRNGEYSYSISVLKPLAKGGDPFAQFALAVMYDDGLGLPQNRERALHWYRESANRGLVDSQYIIGRFYGRGRWGKQDPAKAFFWFNIAAAGGHPYAARLRDQQAHQILPIQRARLETSAVEWQARHPAQYTCKSKGCIYPSWTKSPQWHYFY
jgi:TPR repeat protein